jgi:hypothetical protein
MFQSTGGILYQQARYKPSLPRAHKHTVANVAGYRILNDYCVFFYKLASLTATAFSPRR